MGRLSGNTSGQVGSGRLVLHVKKEYFEQIRDGLKLFEYRRADKWLNRVQRDFKEVLICCGYPKLNDSNRVIRRRWAGYTRRTITHPHFGPDPVDVIAIDLRSKFEEYELVPFRSPGVYIKVLRGKSVSPGRLPW